MTVSDSNEFHKEFQAMRLKNEGRVTKCKVLLPKNNFKRRKLDLKLDLLRNLQSIDQKQLFSPQFTRRGTDNTGFELNSRIQETYH